MKMVEKIAKSTYEKFMEGLIGCTEPSWNDLPQDHKDRMIDAAKAAITTMRKPSKNLIEGVMQASLDFVPINRCEQQALQVWQNTIDAILNEK